jgi:hypothetical protein
MSLATGCAGHAGGMTLTSMRTQQTFNQGFADAYLGRNENGDMDVVLIDTATADLLAGNTPASPVRQIMQLRILWQPQRDLKVTDSASCNATVHWYVIRSQPRGILEYTGTAFVYTTSLGDLFRVHIQNAQVRPLPCSAGLSDPVGPSKIEGAVFAHANPAIVAELLSQVHTPVTDADSVKPAAYTSVAPR